MRIQLVGWDLILRFIVFTQVQDIVPFWTSKTITDAIPNARLISIENFGHFPYIEKLEILFDAVKK